MSLVNYLRIDRHMIRHKEKDEEAGGPGLGKLLTRKRLWKDPSGSIVAERRPEQHKRVRSSISSSDSGNSFRPLANLEPKPVSQPPVEPLSPPKSLLDPLSSDNAHLASDAQLLVSMTDVNPSWQSTPFESYDFLSNASWGTQAQPSSGVDILYDDIFTPDTGKLNSWSASRNRNR